MVDTPSGIVLYNPSTTVEIAVDELGVYLDPLTSVDVTHFPIHILSSADELQGMVSNGTVQIIYDESVSPPTPWSIACALAMLNLGVNSFQVGLQKANTPGVIAGEYYSFAQSDDNIVEGVIVENTIYSVPLNIFGTNFTRIGVSVTTPVANGLIELGIYTNDGGIPGALLLDAGSVPTDTVGNKEIAISFQSPMDWYWLVAVPSANAFVYTDNSGTAALGASAWNSPSTDGPDAFGPLPSMAPSMTTVTQAPPVIWLRQV